MLEQLTRHLDLIPLSAMSSRVHIIGAGATGAMASWMLAKMGFINQHVVDYDTIDVENVGCQMYGRHQIGQLKVDALAEMVELFTGAKISTTNGKFEKGMPVEGIVISALDSMAGRADIFDSFLSSPSATHLIDPRMSIQYGTMFVVDKSNKASIDSYRETLYSDADAVQERCTMKAVMFTSSIISGIICKAVKDIAVDGKTFRSMLYNIEKNDCIFFQ